VFSHKQGLAEQSGLLWFIVLKIWRGWQDGSYAWSWVQQRMARHKRNSVRTKYIFCFDGTFTSCSHLIWLGLTLCLGQSWDWCCDFLLAGFGLFDENCCCSECVLVVEFCSKLPKQHYSRASVASTYFHVTLYYLRFACFDVTSWRVKSPSTRACVVHSAATRWRSQPRHASLPSSLQHRRYQWVPRRHDDDYLQQHSQLAQFINVRCHAAVGTWCVLYWNAF